MKRLTFFVLVLISFCQWSIAQSPNNLNRICLESLEGFLTVNQGDFQAEYTLMPNMSSHSVATYYNYMYIARKN